MSNPNIVYVNYGVANVFGDGTIELHEDLNLKEYKALKQKILKHELRHNFEKGFWYNLKVDFFYAVGFLELLRFMVERPRTWFQILPFYYRKNRGLVYDINLIVFWSIITLGIFSFVLLTKFMGGI